MAIRPRSTHPNAHKFPQGISGAALRALAGAGIRSMDQVARWSESSLRSLRGMSPEALDILKTELAEEGKTFSTLNFGKRVPRITPGSEKPGCCPWCGHDPQLRFFDLLPGKHRSSDVDCRTCGRPCMYSNGRRALAVFVGFAISVTFGVAARGLVGLSPALFGAAVLYAVVAVGIIRTRLRLARRQDWTY
jgi:hypothetical protein